MNDIITSSKDFKSKFFNELKLLIKLSAPLLFTQLGVCAIGFIDSTMAGHYSKSALASIAVGSSIFFPFTMALNGVMMAVTPIIAQLKGGGREKESGAVVKEALWIGFFFAVFLTILVNNVDFLLKTMDLQPGIFITIKKYLFGISIGLPAMAFYSVLRSFVEGLGKTKPQMVIAFITVAFNFAANGILIHGKYGFPELGGAGCGWASGLTFWVFLFCIILYICFDKECRKIDIVSSFSLPSLRGMGEIIKLGLPIGGTIFMECSIFACITLFIGALGSIIVAGHQITLNYSSLVFAIPLSIGMAVTIRVGHQIGAKEARGARLSCFTGIGLAVFCALLTLCFTRFCPFIITSFYTKDKEVIDVSVSLLKIACLYQISDAIMIISQSALRGYKDTFVTFLLTFTAYWVITLPVGYIIGMTDLIVPALGAKGFWISLIIGLSTSGFFLFIRLFNLSRDYIKKFELMN